MEIALTQVIDYVRQGGLTAFLLVLWFLERRERREAEQRERYRMEARAADGDRIDKLETGA